MAARQARRQAARLASTIADQFHPGVWCLDARPRAGRTQFLSQLFELLSALVPAVAPVYLSLGGQAPAAWHARVAAAQLSAAAEGREPAAHAVEARSGGRLHPACARFVRACESTEPGEIPFASALAALANDFGNICVLADDATEPLLRALESSRSERLLVVAACCTGLPAGCQALPLEPLSEREASLVATAEAAGLGVPFEVLEAGDLLEYLGGDAFAIGAVVRAAAAAGKPLNRIEECIAVYIDDLRSGTLANWFEASVPGRPGSRARRFALELLSRHAADDDGPVDDEWLREWQDCDEAQQAADQMRRSRWLVSQGERWLLRAWRAARDWSVLQLAPPAAAPSLLALKVAEGVERASSASLESAAAIRLKESLAGLGAAASERCVAAGLRPVSLEIRHVEVTRLTGGFLFVCTGSSTESELRGAPGLLAICLPSPAARVVNVLAEADRVLQPLAADLPRTALVYRWLAASPQTAPGTTIDRVQRRLDANLYPSWQNVEFEALNRLAATAPHNGMPAAGPGAISVLLPATDGAELSAVRLLDELLERRGWGSEFAARARMSLVEACLNAIEHARIAANDPAAPTPAHLKVTLDCTAEGVLMAVWNPGAPFQPGEGKAQPSAPNRGHGLKIIQAFADNVAIESDLRGTTIKIWKRAPAPASGSANHETAATGTEAN